MSEAQFVDGMIVKRNENAPEYAICKLSIKKGEFSGWLVQQPGDWVNIEIKRSRGGKLYAALDTWKPDGKADAKPAPKPAPVDEDSSIPF